MSGYMRKWKLRGLGSRSLLLLLAWNFFLSFTTFYNQLKPPLDQEGWHGDEYLSFLAIGPIVSILVASLLAEVFLGRYKMIKYCLKVMWLLAIANCILSIVAYHFRLSRTKTFVLNLFLMVIPSQLTFGVFVVCAIPLGMDQLMFGSYANISAFLQWGVWTTFSGIVGHYIINIVLFNFLCMEEYEIDVILSLLCVVLLSVGLILDFFFGHKLVQEPVTVNPVTLIYKVLKYAAKHKNPVRRSAFMYCENERPSRLDNGKIKYGGPFTTEQVEDIKTFGRILIVLFDITILFMPLEALSFISILWKSLGSENTYSQLKTNWLAIGHLVVLLLGIPVYELVVYPCLRNRGPTILQSTLIGAVALIVSSLFGLAIETIHYFISSGTTQCMFTQEDSCFYSYIPLNFLMTYTFITLLKSNLEFLCTQAPYNMKGILVGFYFTCYGVFIGLGILFYDVWVNNISVLDRSRSGIWFYLTTLILTVLPFILLSCVVKHYKTRERDEIPDIPELPGCVIEDIYYKYQEQEERENGTEHTQS